MNICFQVKQQRTVSKQTKTDKNINTTICVSPGKTNKKHEQANEHIQEHASTTKTNKNTKKHINICLSPGGAASGSCSAATGRTSGSAPVRPPDPLPPLSDIHVYVYIYIYIYIYIKYTHPLGLGKGQMGSALMGPVRPPDPLPALPTVSSVRDQLNMS